MVPLADRPTQEFPGEQEIPAFQPQQVIRLTAESPVHRGTYRSTVLAYHNGQMRITLPEENGKLVFIPVGTMVNVFPGDGAHPPTRWRVIDREAGSTRCLVLGIPQPPAPPPQSGPTKRALAISSGKGGVGKTVLAINLAIALQRAGQRVVLVDADLGTANVDVLLNLPSRYTLTDLVRSERPLPEILVEGPEGLLVLPGGSAVQELADLDDHRFQRLYAQLGELDRRADLLLFDTGAGLSRRVTSFLLAAGEIILVTTPEPHAITDAYALVKVVSGQRPGSTFHLVVAMSRSAEEGERVAEKMIFACRRFLNVDLELLGLFRFDPAVALSVRRQQPLILSYPASRAARDVYALAAKLLNLSPPPSAGGLFGWLRRLRATSKENTPDPTTPLAR
ncbi:MAG: P-loop NTPase [Limnochordales bacterium]|nr:P-loop NTPase [Limnochordales bacterium]